MKIKTHVELTHMKQGCEETRGRGRNQQKQKTKQNKKPVRG